MKKNEVMRDAVAHFEGQGYKSGERDIEEIRGRKGRKGKGRDETERGERSIALLVAQIPRRDFPKCF